MFDFSIITQWFDQLLRITIGCPDWLAILIECVLVGTGILIGYALIAIVLIFMERKVCAYFQCRLGPMRVGYWGLLQVFADVLKMLIKEIFFVDRADKVLYLVAPLLVIIGSVGAFSFLPWNNGATVLDFNVGVFLLTAVSSIGVVGIFLAGWGSNNKYSVVSDLLRDVALSLLDHCCDPDWHDADEWYRGGADRPLEVVDLPRTYPCPDRLLRVPHRW